MDIKTLVASYIWAAKGSFFPLENWDLATVPWNHFHFFHFLVSILYTFSFGVVSEANFFGEICWDVCTHFLSRRVNQQKRKTKTTVICSSTFEVPNEEFPSMAQYHLAFRIFLLLAPATYIQSTFGWYVVASN